MLPDFPKIKENIKEILILAAYEEASKDFPVYLMARMKIIHEGKRSSFTREDGSIALIEPKRLSSQMAMKYDECEKISLKEVYEKLINIMRDIVKQQADMFYSTMNESIAKTGNDINLKGQKINSNHIIDILGKIELDFDSNGNPFIPKILPGTKGNESFLEAIKGLQNEPYKTIFDNLIINKRREYLDREGNRKLVG